MFPKERVVGVDRKGRKCLRVEDARYYSTLGDFFEYLQISKGITFLSLSQAALSLIREIRESRCVCNSCNISWEN